MNRRLAWGALLFALIAATLVGVVSYNAGVSHGLAIGPAAAVAPPAGAARYAYYRPWGFGWGLAPLFFLFWWFTWFVVFRGLLWGGMYRRCGYGPGWRTGAFDEWHRRAHEREAEMNKKS
jgi:hypothetical protein